MPNNDTSGGNGAVTALLAILVIAVIAFGIWYVMRHSGAPAPASGSDLQINVGGSTDTSGGSGAAAQ